VKKNKLLIKFASGPLGHLGLRFAFRPASPVLPSPACLQWCHATPPLEGVSPLPSFAVRRYLSMAALNGDNAI